MQVHNKKKSYCMTKFIHPSQKNPNKAQKCCSYAKQYFPFPKDSIPQFAKYLPLRNFEKLICPGLYLGSNWAMGHQWDDH